MRIDFGNNKPATYSAFVDQVTAELLKVYDGLWLLELTLEDRGAILNEVHKTMKNQQHWTPDNVELIDALLIVQTAKAFIERLQEKQDGELIKVTRKALTDRKTFAQCVTLIADSFNIEKNTVRQKFKRVKALQKLKVKFSANKAD